MLLCLLKQEVFLFTLGEHFCAPQQGRFYPLFVGRQAILVRCIIAATSVSGLHEKQSESHGFPASIATFRGI
jgi:hypothetical protein